MTKNVYITDLARFLPNEPVSNDEIEDVLGKVGGKPSRSRKIVLRNNGIQQRYYALDRKTGKFTHNNAQLAAEAIRALAARSGVALDDIDVLACGTSSPDQLKPAHAHMVHGELGSHSCEVASTAGVCSSGVSALKYAYMSVAAGLSDKAVSAGSELASSFMRANYFEPELEARLAALEKRPEIAFEKDFLRWMLSDAAGAALLQAEPNADRPSLRIDWVDCLSYAGEMPPCMYSGAVMKEDGKLEGWRVPDDPHTAIDKSYFAVKQDARFLDEHIMPVSARALLEIAGKHDLKAGQVTWFLPHYSSEYFRPKLKAQLAAIGWDLADERWFTNLHQVGNVGSASIYLIIEELLYSGKLNKGDRLLCYIPESSRFTVCYMLLTVV